MTPDARQHGGDRQGIDFEQSRAHGCARIRPGPAQRFCAEIQTFAPLLSSNGYEQR